MDPQASGEVMLGFQASREVMLGSQASGAGHPQHRANFGSVSSGDFGGTLPLA